MNIDYNLYKIFLHLYEEKSISKTANKLYVSQPAISYSLKELESQLGYSLFLRNSRGIEPTEEAKELYGYISTAFHILQDAETHMKNLNHLEIGTIRIGTSSMGITYLIPKIAQFRKHYPGIQYEIIQACEEELLEMLQTKKVDFILENISRIKSKKWQKKIMIPLPTCFAYHKKNYKKKISSIEELEQHPCLFPMKGTISRLSLEEYLQKKNQTITPVIESNQDDILMQLVRLGEGVGFFTKDFVLAQPDKEDFILLEEKHLPEIEIGFIYREELVPSAVKKLIELWKEKE